MKKNMVSIALAVCMIGTTVPVTAADFTDVPAVENNSEFSDGNATDTCDSYADVTLRFVYSENGETKSVDGELYPIEVPNRYVIGTKVTVPKAVLLEQLTAKRFSIPEGFEWNDDVISFDISDLDFGDQLDIELDKTQTVYLNYYDESVDEKIDEVPVSLSSKVTSVDLSEINAHMPSGYVYAENQNSLPIRDGYVYIPIKKEAKEVKINFYSEDEEKQIAEPTVEVDKDATYVNTSAFANLVPSGYELVESGNLQIRDGYVYAAVRKVATTKEVKINFYSEKEKKQIDEPTIEVDKDATYVNASDLAKLVPSGYKLVLAGDLPIRDGYVYAAVEKVAVVKYKKVKLNFYDEKADKQVKEVTIKVKKTAKSVTVKEIQKSLPKNYTMTTTKTKLPIRDGYVYVAVTKKATAKTQKVKLNFYDEANKKQAAEVTIKVKKGAKSVTLTEAKKYLPEGYTLATTTAKLPIRDGYVYIAVKKNAPKTKSIEINYYCAAEGKSVGSEKLTVDADATYVNTSSFKKVPAKHELVLTGDLTINDGSVFAEVRDVVTTKEVEINYYCAAEGVSVGSEKLTVDADATYVNTSSFKKVPAKHELVLTGDLTINDGSVFAEVRDVVTTKEIEVVYYCTSEDKTIGEEMLTVNTDATEINTSELKNIPANHRVAGVGPIIGGYVSVNVTE